MSEIESLNSLGVNPNTGTGVASPEEVDLTANDPNVAALNRKDLTANDPNVQRLLNNVESGDIVHPEAIPSASIDDILNGIDNGTNPMPAKPVMEEDLHATADGRVAADPLADLGYTKQEGDPELYRDSADKVMQDGTFDEYVAKVEAARAAAEQEVAEHNEQVADVLGEDVPDEITDEDIRRSNEEFHDRNITDLDDPDNLAASFDDDDDEEYSAPSRHTTTSYEFDDEDDEEELDDDGLDDDDDTESLKELQKEITDKITPISNKLDLSTFTIVKSTASVNNTLVDMEVPVVDWALLNTKMHFGLSRLSGVDIASLAAPEGANAFSRAKWVYNIFFQHLVGEDKPKKLIDFVKTVRYADNDFLYGAAYVGAFEDANYIPYDCDVKSCGNTFLSDNIPIKDMYHFKNKEDEALFNSIRSGHKYELTTNYVTAVVPISDKFAVSLRSPSIYDVVFAPALLDDKFTKKYKDTVDILPYLDTFYILDVNNHCMSPVEPKEYPKNEVKTIKSRVTEFHKIIKCLTADQYNVILAYIGSLTKEYKTMEWEIPEAVCTKCGKVIKKKPADARSLLFMRHQLAALATSPLN